MNIGRAERAAEASTDECPERGGVRGGQPNLHSVRDSAYDALRKTSPKSQDEAEYGVRAMCIVHTWRGSSFMFHQGRLAMPSVRRGDLKHATLLFCTGERRKITVRKGYEL